MEEAFSCHFVIFQDSCLYPVLERSIFQANRIKYSAREMPMIFGRENCDRISLNKFEWLGAEIGRLDARYFSPSF
jgi:hypothetical protein